MPIFNWCTAVFISSEGYSVAVFYCITDKVDNITASRESPLALLLYVMLTYSLFLQGCRHVLASDGMTCVSECGVEEYPDKASVCQPCLGVCLQFVSSLQLSLTENTPSGSSVYLAQVHDRRMTNRTLEFAITGGNTGQTFSIDPATGELSLSLTLDREVISSYSLTVEVVDAGSTPISVQSATAVLLIAVEDINDSPPMFQLSQYQATISESTPVGITLLNVSATDSDQGSNADLAFSLAGSSLPFAMEPATGAVITTASLDYEEQQQYNLVAIATDGGTPPLSSSAEVVIRLVNENDERPFFLQPLYQAAVSELIAVGNSVLTLTVADPDTPNSTLGLSFTILPSNGSSTFIIQQTTGVLVTTASLDREQTLSYTLEVVVADGQPNTNPSGTATVVITIEDANDNAPLFLLQEAMVVVEVSESTGVGTEVLDAKAEDADSGVNAAITYLILTAGNATEFSITSNGSLILTSTLDREATSTYLLIVEAADGGSPSLSSVLQVMVVVTDVNDNPPVFSQDSVSVSVSESLPLNSTLLTLNASDRDIGQNAQLLFMFQTTNNTLPFAINPQSGEVVLEKTLDFETVSLYLFNVTAVDMGTPALSSSTLLSVAVLDHNDNLPLFSQANYSAIVPEDHPIGQLVLQVSASDEDSGLNSEITYNIDTGNVGNVFAINTSNGRLTTTQSLDFEARPLYELTVIARNSFADPMLASSVTVHIHLTDSNEFRPMFSQAVFEASVVENAPEGTLVLQLAASDADGGSAGVLRYSITGVEEFTITDNGTLFSSQPFDREAQQTYTLTIMVEDLGSPSFSSSAVVTVTILDLNDSPPSFSSSLYTSLIPENSPSSTVLSLSPPLVATDDDSPGPNSLLTFALIGVDLNGLFTVIPSTGQLLTAAPLDFEQLNQTQFTIVVRDSGSPQLTSSATVRVIITDQNDHPPTINALPTSTVFTEGQTNVLVASGVSVLDQDSLPLQLVTASIVNADGLPSTHPDILSFTQTIPPSLTITSQNEGRSLSVHGLITTIQASSLLQSLVFSNTEDEPAPVPRYLTVTVSDGVFTSSSNLSKIIVQAVNDHSPQLSLDSSSASGNITVMFTEGGPPIRLTAPSVSVFDGDSGPHSLLLTVQLLDPPDGAMEGISLSGGALEGITVSPSNHSITAQGSAPFSTFEQLLTLLQYYNSAEEPTGVMREVLFSLSDGSLSSALLASTVMIEHVNDPPLLDLGGSVDYEVVFVEGRGPVNLSSSSSFLLSDADDSQLVNGSVELLNNLDEADEHLLLDSTGLTTSITLVNTSLILIMGPAPVLEFSNAFSRVQYRNNLGSPSPQRREVLFSVSDGQSTSQATAFISFSLVNDPPIVDLNGKLPGNDFSIDFLEGNQPVHPVSSDVIIRDIDSPLLVNATIVLSSTHDGDQEGLMANSSDLDIQLEVSTHTITITGKASPTQYTAVLSTLLYFNSAAEPTGGVRMITVEASDGDKISDPAFVSVTVVPVNDRPAIRASGPTVIEYVEESSATELLTNLLVSDSDNNTLSHVLLVMSGVTNGELESLSFSDPSSDQSLQVTQTSSAPGTRQYTFSFSSSSSSTLSNFQELLSSLAYLHTSPEPSAGLRSITLSLSDGLSVSEETRVIVNVTLINDNSPMFTSGQLLLQASVPENAVGVEVITVSAVDGDAASGPFASDGEVVYTISNGNTAGHFDISSASGAISVLQPLDREGELGFFSLTVTASNPSPLSTGASFPSKLVLVTITDQNDNAPQWVSLPYQFITIEHSSGAVGSLSATDADAGFNKEIRYSIANGNTAGAFSINPLSGVISVSNSSVLDREETPTFLLEVEVTDLGVPQLVNLTTASIELLDINDHHPTFSLPSYSGIVSEQAAVGTPVIRVSATDPDLGPNGTIIYSVLGTDAFTIVNFTGELLTATQLDRELQGEYTFTIVAADQGSPSLSSNTSISVKVEDSNDNRPVFTQLIYNASVAENTPPMQPILTITAEDMDSGNNSVIVYSITASSELPFAIDSTTGEVILTTSLDREEEEKYDFSVTAADLGTPSLSSSVNVTVLVLDVNDNDPQFDSPHYMASLTENAPLMHSVLTVSALDRDEGSNSVLSYSIISGENFSINTTTGEVLVAGSIDREEQGEYVLTIGAADQGSPPLSSQTLLTITVLDENDNQPQFSALFYSFSVLENQPPSPLGLVVASDNDQGSNAVLTFSIAGGSLLFAINSSSGMLSSTGQLDREEVSQYNLTVVAIDGGSPRQSSTTTVTVVVEDVNDHPPLFLQQSYTRVVSEELPTGSTLLQVQARDGDVGNNGDITYTIASGDDRGQFSINHLSGEVVLVKELDAESYTALTFLVKAEDHGTPSLFSLANLTVHVTNINDNAVVISIPTTEVQFTEQGPDLIIAPIVLVTDLDLSAVVTSASVQLANCSDQACEGRLLPGSQNSNVSLTESANGRTINISGNASDVEVSSVLRAVRYRNLNAEFQKSNQTVVFTVSDGLFTSQATVTILLVAINDNAPVVDLDSSDVSPSLGYQTTFTEGSSGAAISSSPVLTDADTGSAGIDHITVSLLNPFDDPLEFITANSSGQVTVFPASGGVTVQLLGPASLQEFTTVLSTALYHNMADNPTSLFNRTVEVRASDGQLLSTPAVAVVTVQPVNDPPTLLLGGTTANYSTVFVEDGGPTSLTAESLKLTDPDSSTFVQARVELLNPMDGADDHLVVLMPGSVSVQQPSAQVLLISIRAVISQYSALLQAVRYLNNASEPSSGERTVQFTVSDGQLNTTAYTTVVVQLRNDPPLVTLSQESVVFTEQGPPVVPATISISDPDSELLQSVTVTLLNASDGDQELLYIATTLSSTFSLTGNATHSLTLHFNTTPDVYESVLSSLRYINTEDEPSGTRRQIVFTASDGESESLPAAVDVVFQFVDDAPQLKLNSLGASELSIFYLEESGPVPLVDSTAGITDSDSPSLSHLTVTLTSVLDGSQQESLVFNNLSSLLVHLSTEKEMISYNFSFPTPQPVAVFSQLLLSLQYQNTAPEPNNSLARLVTITVSDLSSISSPVATTVNITLLDDNQPMFDSPQYNYSVLENSSVGVEIGQVSARDLDIGGSFLFRIQSGIIPFTIDPSSGSVSVSGALDREEQALYSFVVVLTQTQTPFGVFDSQTVVTVSILDVNEPPVFNQSSYQVSISEDALLQTEIASIMAVDRDEGTNAVLSYTLQGSEQVSVDSETGTITVTSELDREMQPVLELVLTAMDTGNPPLQTTVPVTLIVLDANDNPPLFSQPIYTSQLVETDPVNTSVLMVAATDADEGPNAQFTFSLSSASSPFAISTVGLLTVASSLAPIRYNLTALATDMGSPSLHGTATIIINVLSADAVLPVFSQPLYRASIDEDAPEGSFLISVNATDPLTDLPVQYVITTVGFAINSTTGNIIVNTSLDRETQASYQFQVSARSSDGEREGFAQVVVSVLDVNDFPPQFTQSSYTFSLPEGSAIGSMVGLVRALDANDEGSNAQILNYFSLSEEFNVTSTGEIISLRVFDREEESEYTFTVLAMDAGIPSQTGSANVSVTITDINDNAPVFAEEVYTVSVAEDKPVGFQLLNVSARDADSGVAGSVKYSTNSSVIITDSVTGATSTAAVLDFESVQMYVVELLATDAGQPQLTGSAMLLVTVTDVDDTAPVFTEPLYHTQIEEGSPPSILHTLVAIDVDSGSDNPVQYHILIGNSDMKFLINSSSGVLQTLTSLDRENTSRHTLTVAASNMDASGSLLSSTTMVTVEVLDVNDNAPNFVEKQIDFTVSENALAGTVVGTVEVTDEDLGLNATVGGFRIEGGDTQRAFSIGAESGLITVGNHSSLDRETTSNYTLLVSVHDQGIPPLTSSTEVSVVVTDINDNPPVFVGEVIRSVAENASIGETVFIITAIDADSGSNAVIRYSIPESSTAPFTVNATTGEVALTSSLDYETKNSYELVVIAADEGIPSLNSSTILMILVVDVDDSFPVFEPSMYSAGVFEDAPIGHPLITVTALDPDTDSRDIVYSLLNATNQFSIGSSTGLISISSSLDRELQSQYILTVTALSFPTTPATATITVEVLDINDVAPHFDQQQYTFIVAESTQPVAMVGTVGIRDEDLGVSGDISNLFLSPPHSSFEIDNKTHAILLVEPVDYEAQSNISLVLTAVDGGPSQLTGSVEVLISVEDANDNQPVFTTNTSIVSVADSTTVNTTIFTVQAEDADSGLNGMVVYSLLQSSFLSVDSNTGELTVTKLLVAGVYSLQVVATDLGSPPLSSQFTLTLTVTDTNEPPLFPSSLNTVDVAENEDTETIVFQATAVDPDMGVNAELVYTIEPNTMFSINASSGEVSLLQSLDFEQATVHQLNITAVDRGDPPLSALTTLRVHVLDENDNSPVFSTTFYTATVPEDTSLGQAIITVNATDADSTSNGAISYSIVASTVNISSPFNIDITSGKLRVGQELDYESIQSVTLMVEARDGGQPVLSNTTLVTISVTDVDDNPPVFSESLYTASVYEDEEMGSAVLTVDASDIDSGDNAAVFFRIVNSSLPFTVNSTTGAVVVDTPGLDRELQDEYSFLIEAYNPFSSTFSSTTGISITILDVNDNAPQFSLTGNYTFSVPESLSLGLSIGSVMAVDADEGSNGSVLYHFTSTHFSVDADSGQVTLVAALDYELIPQFMLVVVASDQGSPALNSTATVTVLVENENDNVPVISSNLTTFTFTEASSPVTIGHSITISDPDDLLLTNATAQLMLSDLIPPSDGDFLLLPSSSLTVISSTQSLIITGPASLQAFTSALQQLQYGNSASEPSLSTRVVQVSVSDGNFVSSSLLLYVSVQPVNDNPPVLDLNSESETLDIQLTYTEGQSGALQLVPASAILADADVGNNTISFTTVTLLNPFDGELEQLQAEQTSSIQVHQVSTNTLNLTGPAPLAVFMEALRTVSYSNTAEEPTNTTQQRQVLFLVSDGKLTAEPSSSFVTIMLTNDPPVLIPARSLLTYSDRNNSARLLDVNLVFYDIDSSSIAFVRITLVEFIQGVERLSFSLSGNISAQAVDGTLMLVGPASVEEFRHVLLSVEYINMDINQSLPANFTGSKRVQFVANDGFASSSTSELIITFIGLNDSPLVDLNGPLTPGAGYSTGFLEEGNPVNIASSNASVVDVDSAQLVYASISIVSNRHDGEQESLNLSSSSLGIAMSYNPLTAELVLTGAAPVTSYEQLIRSVTYYNNHSEPTPGERTIRVVVGDGAADSFPVHATINVEGVNDPPHLSASPLYLPFTEQGQPAQLLLPTSISLSDTDSPILSRIDVSLFPFPDGGSEAVLFTGSNLTGLVISQMTTDSTLLYTFSFVPEPLGTVTQFISLLSGLSYENTASEPDSTSRQIVISVSDGVLSSSSLSLSMNITLVNDNAPLFTPETETVSIPEDTQAGEVVFVAVASDADEFSNLTYTIEGSKLFMTNSTTGQVVVVGALDRETQATHNITITANDGEHQAHLHLFITLTDINDNTPIFSEHMFTASVAENSPPGTPVTDLVAVDGDQGQNAQLVYSITQGNTGQAFTINSTSGEVTVVGDIDFEAFSSYMLIVEVRDSGFPSLTNTSSVLVSILNLNDNPPEFPSEVTSISIPENTLVNSTVFTTEAVDADGDNITYQIQLSSDDLFAINSLSGEITLLGELDRETAMNYTLIVLATDSGLPPLSSALNLAITVADVDDNPPSFSASSNLLLVHENVSIPMSLLDLMVEDLDEGLNAAIVFSITAGNSADKFSVSNSGTFSVVGGLDREMQASYHLIIRVQSPVTASHFDITTLNVTVLDVNDNPPQFQQNSFTFSVLENATVGMILGDIAATDADEGINALTSYSLSDAGNVFSVTAGGKLVLSSGLDREQEPFYTLTVQAADTNAPNMTATATVVVSVGDVNEFPPLFQQPLINTSIRENSPMGTQVASLLATNPDNNPLTTISYTITPEQSHLFSIDALTGNLSTRVVFDFELNATTYNITVLARDTGMPPLTSTAVVLLTIEDVNEFTPLFTDSFLSASVPEGTGKGAMVTRVQATDIDRGSTGIVMYRLIGEVPDSPFEFNHTDGSFAVNGTLDRESIAAYNFTIEAYNPINGEGLTSTVNLRIIVLDVNDNAPVFTEISYSAVLPSNLPAGSSVLQLVAADADEGVNAKVTYSITNQTELFEISQSSGLFSTSSLLIEGVFLFTVVANDSGQPSLTASATVTITIVAPFSVSFSISDGPGFLLQNFTSTTQHLGLFVNQPPGSSGSLSAQLTGVSSVIPYQSSLPPAYFVEGWLTYM